MLKNEIPDLTPTLQILRFKTTELSPIYQVKLSDGDEYSNYCFIVSPSMVMFANTVIAVKKYHLDYTSTNEKVLVIDDYIVASPQPFRRIGDPLRLNIAACAAANAAAGGLVLPFIIIPINEIEAGQSCSVCGMAMNTPSIQQFQQNGVPTPYMFFDLYDQTGSIQVSAYNELAHANVAIANITVGSFYENKLFFTICDFKIFG